MTGPLLEIDRLVVEYPLKGRGVQPFRVLKEVSLDIRPGISAGVEMPPPPLGAGSRSRPATSRRTLFIVN